MAFRPTILARDWLVTTEHYLSAQAGAAILQAGGTAVDAAAAAVLVECVVNPHMLSFGGEVPMLVHEGATGAVHVVNGHTITPRGLTLERCRAAGLDARTALPADHPLAWGVPATPHALCAALARWGTRTFAEVAAPARDLARRGFPMHPGLRGPGESLSIAAEAAKFRTRWTSTAELYMPGGQLPAVGTRLVNADMADTLDGMIDAERRANGSRAAGLAAARDAFYRGDPAAIIDRFVRERDGVLDKADLEAYETRIEVPLRREFAGLTVHKCPPWSTGGVLLQTLALLEPDRLVRMGHNSADYLHTLAEALKLTFADRERYYGDPRLVQVPMDALLSDAYAAVRRGLIDPARASLEMRPGDPRGMRALAEGPGGVPGPPGRGTVHVNVVDAARNMVSATASGAWITGAPVVPGLGFPLTNRPQTFSLDPAHPNVVGPGKQPRTTLTPSLVLERGRPKMVLGTTGGDNQDQWNLQVFLSLTLFGMPVQDAIEAPRISSHHWPNSFYPHEARPGVLRIEARVPYEVRRDLQARGHKLELRPDWAEGYVLAIVVDEANGHLMGGADPRGEVATVIPGYAIGW
jgi:gamma-glutamyltranspeptidase/glutathione hydrolase